MRTGEGPERVDAVAQELLSQPDIVQWMIDDIGKVELTTINETTVWVAVNVANGMFLGTRLV